MDIFKRAYFWIAVFLLVFLLAQDYLFMKWPEKLALLGLPNWLWWFIGLHAIFIVLIHFFSQKYWRE